MSVPLPLNRPLTHETSTLTMAHPSDAQTDPLTGRPYTPEPLDIDPFTGRPYAFPEDNIDPLTVFSNAYRDRNVDRRQPDPFMRFSYTRRTDQRPHLLPSSGPRESRTIHRFRWNMVLTSRAQSHHTHYRLLARENPRTTHRFRWNWGLRSGTDWNHPTSRHFQPKRTTKNPFNKLVLNC